MRHISLIAVVPGRLEEVILSRSGLVSLLLFFLSAETIQSCPKLYILEFAREPQSLTDSLNAITDRAFEIFLEERESLVMRILVVIFNIVQQSNHFIGILRQSLLILNSRLVLFPFYSRSLWKIELVGFFVAFKDTHSQIL